MTKKLGVGAIVIAILVSAGVFYGRIFKQSRVAPSDVPHMNTHISQLLDAHSAADAYAIFKQEYAAASQPDQHTAAHIFGDHLYEKEGVDGFSICDGSFGFGCYHTFIPLAIADHGESVVQELDAACVRAYGEAGLGCSHGIGHGLIAHFGYGEGGLRSSLALCKTLSWNRPYGGCRDGAFMEYNLRTMITDPTLRGRPFTHDTAYQPCDSVDAASKSACYFNLPQWWQQALPESSQKLSTLGTLCAGVKSGASQTACFRGIGYAYVPLTSFDAARGISLCDSLSISHSQNVECREGVAWGLYADPAYRQSATTACTQGLTKDDSARCLREYLFTLQ